MGTAEPTRGSAGFAPKGQAQSQPEGGPRGAKAITTFKIGMISTLKCAQIVLVAPGKIGRQGEPLEVFHDEWYSFIGKQEPSMGIVPGPCFVSLTTKGELIQLLKEATIALCLI
jgi:hypothetical protein